jgi:hypothetical protein
MCGASVIGSGAVLTAAHCVDGVGGDPSKITLFISDTNSVTPTVLFIHPLWNGDVSDGHDLAVLKVPPTATSGVTPPQVGSPGDAGHGPAQRLGHGRHLQPLVLVRLLARRLRHRRRHRSPHRLLRRQRRTADGPAGQQDRAGRRGYWEIYCGPQGTTTTTTRPRTTSTTETTISRVCQQKPWTPGCEA